MKHLLSLCIAVYFIINSVFAQQNEELVIRTIKGKDYIIYKVKPGDTWESIAQKFSVLERALIDENPQTEGTLKGVSTLKVPYIKSVFEGNNNNDAPKSALAEPVQPKVKTNGNKPQIFGQEIRTEFKGGNSLIVYKVGNGDKIENLAKYYNCAVSDISKQNNLVNNTLVAGKIIKIPVVSANNATVPAENQPAEKVTTEISKPTESETPITESKTVEVEKPVTPSEVTINDLDLAKATKSETPPSTNTINNNGGKPIIKGQELRTEFKGANSLIVYKVGNGDKIENIAKFYNCSITDITKRNNLTSNTLTVGRIIKIPVITTTNNSEIAANQDSPKKTETPIAETKSTEVEKPISSIPNEETNTVKVTKAQSPIKTNSVNSNGGGKPTIKGQEIRTEFKGANSLIVYKVGNGDKIENIAKYYNCSVTDITKRNNLTSNTLAVGRIIKIPVVSANNNNNNNENNTPAAGTPTETPVQNVSSKQLEKSNVETAMVESKATEATSTSNDNAPSVKDVFTESVADLKANEIKLGDYIVLKKLGKYYIKHMVISGEDLSRIAKENYSTNVKIVNTNNLKTPKLKTGQVLLIPTNKATLLKLTGLDIDKVEAENAKLMAEKNASEPENIVNQNTTSNNQLAENNTTTNPKVSSNNSNTTSNLPLVKDTSARYNWGDPLLPPFDKLDSNAKKTIEDKAKDINIKEVHANANPGETKESFTHLVQNGETIEGIAKKYKISPSDIANWNNLYQNRIRVGQDLIVNLERARKPYLALNTVDPETQKAIKKADKSDRIKSVEEKGLAYLSDDKFIGIAHKNVPVGTLILITSTENYKKIYVRVTSILVNDNPDVIIQVDKNIAKQLALNSQYTNILISYSLVE